MGRGSVEVDRAPAERRSVAKLGYRRIPIMDFSHFFGFKAEHYPPGLPGTA
jgi:hypothetical protein